ncbi:MAG: hypothetical protein LBJ17_07640 [Dysgonamonadaceae bacterium]|jgi:hypothetical protein|nr:hypothetical protein [Dysgonamonadaceae bacterium]
MKKHIYKVLRHFAASITIVLIGTTTVWGQQLRDASPPAGVDPTTWKLRLWLRADKGVEFATVINSKGGSDAADPGPGAGQQQSVTNPETPTDIDVVGTTLSRLYTPLGTLQYYHPYEGEYNPTGPHYKVTRWNDYSPFITRNGTGYTNYTNSADGAGYNRMASGTNWIYDPWANIDNANRQHRQLIPVYLEEHKMMNYHPSVYFWYHSPDGNYADNISDEQGAYLSNVGNASINDTVPFWHVSLDESIPSPVPNGTDVIPEDGEHTALFVVTTTFPQASTKRVNFMGFNRKHDDNGNVRPAWGIYRLESNSSNKDNGMSSGRTRYTLNGYEDNRDPGLIQRGATTIAGYQTQWNGNGINAKRKYNNVERSFVFSGSRMRVDNGNEDDHFDDNHTIHGGTRWYHSGTIGIANDRFMGGLMGEALLYEKKLPSAELLRVNSYLALKYGITLRNYEGTNKIAADNNYVRGTYLQGYNDYYLSDGTRIWNGTVAAPGEDRIFYNNVSAVIRDDNGGLLNYQSHSTDAGSIVRMGWEQGDIHVLGPNMKPTDFANPITNFPDKKYVIWGNDAGTDEYSIPASQVCIDNLTILRRVWLVHKSDVGTPYPMMISALNNNIFFQDNAFPYDEADEAYLLIANSYADAKAGLFTKVIKAEYHNGEHQFRYEFTKASSYFCIGVVSSSVQGCTGKYFPAGKYMDFWNPTKYVKGNAKPFAGYTTPSLTRNLGDDLTATMMVTYDNPPVNRPSLRYPKVTKHGLLRIARKGGSPTANINKVQIEVNTKSTSIPAMAIPAHTSFVISSINRTCKTSDEVKIYGRCEGSDVNIPARLSYRTTPERSRYTIVGNIARAIRSGSAGKHDLRGQTQVTFDNAVSKVFIDYSTQVPYRRNYIDISPMTFNPAPLPPAINSDGLALQKSRNKDVILTCIPVDYTFRISNFNEETNISTVITDTLPSGMEWAGNEVIFNDSVNQHRYENGLITVSQNGRYLKIDSVLALKKCNTETDGVVNVTVTAIFTATIGAKYDNRAWMDYRSLEAPNPLVKLGSRDLYTDSLLTVVNSITSNPSAKVKVAVKANPEAYRENDVITVVYTLSNDGVSPAATVKSNVEFDFFFDAGFTYVADSFDGSSADGNQGTGGTVHSHAGDPSNVDEDELYIEGMTIPIGTSTFRFKLKAPAEPEIDEDENGVPVVDPQTGEPVYMPLTLEYEAAIDAGDECDVLSLDSLTGEIQVPYLTMKNVIVVNQEINHTFIVNQYELPPMPGFPSLANIEKYLRTIGETVDVEFTDPIGVTGTLTYNWEFSSKLTAGGNPGNSPNYWRNVFTDTKIGSDESASELPTAVNPFTNVDGTVLNASSKSARVRVDTRYLFHLWSHISDTIYVRRGVKGDNTGGVFIWTEPVEIIINNSLSYLKAKDVQHGTNCTGLPFNGDLPVGSTSLAYEIISHTGRFSVNLQDNSPNSSQSQCPSNSYGDDYTINNTPNVYYTWTVKDYGQSVSGLNSGEGYIITDSLTNNIALQDTVIYEVTPRWGYTADNFTFDLYVVIGARPPCVEQTCFSTLYLPDPTKITKIPTHLPNDTLTFLNFNLGACPYLTPKQQMAYVSPMSITAEDVNVYGGLFQWGRKDSESALRCSMTDNIDLFSSTLYLDEDDYKYSDSKFIFGGFNWISSTSLSAQRSFWGNGEGLTKQTVVYTEQENLYDPCPPGWRVPTQYEWALVGFEGGDMTSISGDAFYSDINGTSFNGVVWVPVVDGRPSVSWTNGTTTGSTIHNPPMTGYAIYAKADSAAAISYAVADVSNKLYDEAAPEPLMFLPASGFRDGQTGKLFDTGNNGSYWTGVASDSDNYAYNLWFNQDKVNAFGETSNGSYISTARSVRCVKE